MSILHSLSASAMQEWNTTNRLCKNGISKLSVENDYQSQLRGGGAKKQVKSMLI